MRVVYGRFFEELRKRCRGGVGETEVVEEARGRSREGSWGWGGEGRAGGEAMKLRRPSGVSEERSLTNDEP